MHFRGYFISLLLVVTAATGLFLVRSGLVYAGNMSGENEAPFSPAVKIQPASLFVKTGSTFQISVVIDSLTSPLSGFQFDLQYDPELVRLVEAGGDSFLGSRGRMEICPQPITLEDGKVRLSCVGAGGQPGPSGSGVLVTLTFMSVASGTTPISLSSLQLAGPGVVASEITAATTGGKVTVGEGSEIYLPLIQKGQ